MSDPRRMVPYRKAEFAWPAHGGYRQVDGKQVQNLSGYLHPAGKMNRKLRREAFGSLSSRKGRKLMKQTRWGIPKLVPKEAHDGR